MVRFIIFSLIIISINSCKQEEGHTKPTHNFTVQRLIILNDQDEMLMCRQENVWVPPSFLFKERQFTNEAMDSLAKSYGIKIKNLELRGVFGFKYDYHKYATLRDYFVAEYDSGTIIVPENIAEVKWLPISDAIEINSVTAIKEITRQIINKPRQIWGGSFMISNNGVSHPTKMVEDFYPLFNAHDSKR